MGGNVPFLALLAIPALDSELLLENAGDVTPLADFAGLEDILEESVFFLGPGSFFSHYLVASYSKPIIADQPTANLHIKLHFQKPSSNWSITVPKAWNYTSAFVWFEIKKMSLWIASVDFTKYWIEYTPVVFSLRSSSKLRKGVKKTQRMQCAFQKSYVKPYYNPFLLKKLIQNWHILICILEKVEKKYPENLVARYFQK